MILDLTRQVVKILQEPDNGFMYELHEIRPNYDTLLFSAGNFSMTMTIDHDPEPIVQTTIEDGVVSVASVCEIESIIMDMGLIYTMENELGEDAYDHLIMSVKGLITFTYNGNLAEDKVYDVMFDGKPLCEYLDSMRDTVSKRENDLKSVFN